MTYSSKFLVPKFFTLLVLMVVCVGSAFSQRMYDSSGRQVGRVDSERYYDSSGRQMGRVDGLTIYDASGRQIGRIDGNHIHNSSGSQVGRSAHTALLALRWDILMATGFTTALIVKLVEQKVCDECKSSTFIFSCNPKKGLMLSS
jgi:sporulation protein YlmC with PRC-barrel domain